MKLAGNPRPFCEFGLSEDAQWQYIILLLFRSGRQALGREISFSKPKNNPFRAISTSSLTSMSIVCLCVFLAINSPNWETRRNIGDKLTHRVYFSQLSAEDPDFFQIGKTGAVFIGRKDDDWFDTKRVLHLFLKNSNLWSEYDMLNVIQCVSDDSGKSNRNLCYKEKGPTKKTFRTTVYF